MKKILLTLSIALANFAWAQFTTGTVTLSTGMTVKLDTSPTLATLTLTGPNTSFLGIGFGGTGTGGGMGNGVDGFIYNVDSTTNTNLDYTFAGVGNTPNPDAVQDWTITSNTVASGTRTIVATRSLSGGAGDTAFTNTAGNMNIFFAKGPSTTLAYHGGGTGNRGYAVLTKAGTLGVTDIVAENKKIRLYPNPAKETVSFNNADKIQSVDIYESTGRKVKTVKIDGENISVSDLKSGNYYFEITLKDGSTAYQKLIKE
ncbi:T9SS type A sorting domain-containing protein [Chryseobacterium sp. Ch-15]|uniref:T9SS type A sorting domain-containing protein n=1 Tax=Chryseobacterium muglaense TaxID=2893752 RepID=A0A9Q3UV84_9FLAO|nr:T9SS type A sorting domain-containing protein [Chryseobacterium muglaense]MBD3905867.1 T9SS type A sorting domain-containing protein [Chryseobacterium muglaense]MCC9035749.1 T9SS type A sorting domain-containing protein [Chryseobacterium muglaense]MCM2555459.1 T9SS type A sorting domain-containing protein [Chryseobacterium muglaense]